MTWKYRVGTYQVLTECESCKEPWSYDNRERLGQDRPLCVECETNKEYMEKENEMGCDSQFDGARNSMPYPKTLVKDKGPNIQTTVFPPSVCTGGTTKELADTSKKWNSLEQVVEKEQTRLPLTEFEQELRLLVNRYHVENFSNTPDRILAEYLHGCLNAFNIAVKQREQWYGRKVF